MSYIVVLTEQLVLISCCGNVVEANDQVHVHLPNRSLLHSFTGSTMCHLDIKLIR